MIILEKHYPVEISIIIPVYNEEKYIERCLNSLKEQSYPKVCYEVLVIDGGSSDKTISLAKKYHSIFDLRILNNKKRQVTYALNIGIRESKGKYIIRMDAHAEYDKDYIKNCISTLKSTGADNVGGVAQTVGLGKIGKVNAEILSSKFGVGNSNFRLDSKSGYVDTVPFGAFKREIFDKIGLFNPELPRSEDNDFNSRIRASGGKVYLSSDIKFIYYCRESVQGLLDQDLKNGNALFLTLRKNPKAMSVRHFVPFTFLLSLVTLVPLSVISPKVGYVLSAEMIAYLACDTYFSVFKGDVKNAPIKLVLYPAFHLTYGAGSFLGLIGVKLY